MKTINNTSFEELNTKQKPLATAISKAMENTPKNVKDILDNAKIDSGEVLKKAGNILAMAKMELELAKILEAKIGKLKNKENLSVSEMFATPRKIVPLGGKKLSATKVPVDNTTVLSKAA